MNEEDTLTDQEKRELQAFIDRWDIPEWDHPLVRKTWAAALKVERFRVSRSQVCQQHQDQTPSR